MTSDLHSLPMCICQRISAAEILLLRDTHLPSLIRSAGDHASRRFVEFFTAHIRNPGTRAVYARAVNRFCRWCDRRSVTLYQVSPFIVANYIEQLTHQRSAPTVKLHLAAIRMLFDFLVVGQVLPFNPAASVRGPKHVVNKGKTPVLSAEEARQLLDSIDTGKIGGLRDRALIGLMVFSFARVSAAIGMNVEDYYPQGRRMWFRLHEKGGKHHDVPAHHNAIQYVDDYIDAAGISEQKKTPLFRTLSRQRWLTDTSNAPRGRAGDGQTARSPHRAACAYLLSHVPSNGHHVLSHGWWLPGSCRKNSVP